MTGRRVGILPDDQHAYAGQRLAEGTQDAVTGRQILPTGSDFGAQELAHRGDVLLHRFEHRHPLRVHQLAQWSGDDALLTLNGSQ